LPAIQFAYPVYLLEYIYVWFFLEIFIMDVEID